MAIRVEFHGICTHVKRAPNAGTGALPFPHRVILVDSRNGMTLDGQFVPEHKPILRIPKTAVDEENPLFPGKIPPNDGDTCYWWNLGGYGMRIDVENVAHGVSYSYQWATAMPKIRSFIPGFRALPQIVVGLEEHVAALVELEVGVLDVICRKGASGALLTIPSPGQRHQLDVWRLDDATCRSTIRLKEEADVLVEHAEVPPVSRPDSLHQPQLEGPHFLLHYLIGGEARIPHHAMVHSTPCIDSNLPMLCGDDGAGLGAFCSNTDYP